MLRHRIARGRRILASAGAFATILAPALVCSAASMLSGYVYIDRDNNGEIAFQGSANPEWVVPDVEIRLYSLDGEEETLVASTMTNDVGYYQFAGLAPGTYCLLQTQREDLVDGLDTLGSLVELLGQAAPAATAPAPLVAPDTPSPGIVIEDGFDEIEFSDDVVGKMYNFGELGLQSGYVSKRYLLDSAPGPIPEPTGISLVSALAMVFGLARRRRR